MPGKKEEPWAGGTVVRCWDRASQGWLPRRQPQAQAEMGYNLTTSALPPSREVPPKEHSLLSSKSSAAAECPLPRRLQVSIR